MEKKLATEVEELKVTYPDAEIQLWCEDEQTLVRVACRRQDSLTLRYRLGLKPIHYSTDLCPRRGNTNRRMSIGDLNGYGCMHSYILKQEKQKAWILPYVNTELFNQVLADFARELELGAKKHILLAVDRAGWHISHDLKIPEGLHLTLLPSYSPELQPAERLWTLVDEPIANQSFKTLDDLEEVLFQRCQSLLQMKDFIQGLTGFHWWIKIGV